MVVVGYNSWKHLPLMVAKCLSTELFFNNHTLLKQKIMFIPDSHSKSYDQISFVEYAIV